MEYISQWECVEGASSTVCSILATTTGNSVTYYDWLFVNSVQIFLLSFVFIGIFFGLLKTKKT